VEAKRHSPGRRFPLGFCARSHAPGLLFVCFGTLHGPLQGHTWRGREVAKQFYRVVGRWNSNRTFESDPALSADRVERMCAFGDVDVYTTADVPDSVSAAAVCLAANQRGTIASKTNE
jgi:hypothetical protein